MTEKIHYVYLHRYASGPREGEVFYVGKGKDYRASANTPRGRFWKNVYNKYGKTVEIAKDGMSEDCAFTLERILISRYRALGQAIANLTDGGEGASGAVMPQSAKDAISLSKIKPVYSSLGESFNSQNEAVSWLSSVGYSKPRASAISMCCNGKIKYAYDRVWSFYGTPKHTHLRPTIYCSNGMTFESQARAVYWLRNNGFPNARTQKIGDVIAKRSKTAYGLVWSKEKAPN